MYIYIGEITKVDNNLKSYFTDSNGKELVMTGGKVGEVAVYNELRRFYMAVDKELWLGLGGSLTPGAAIEVDSGNIDELKAQIARLKAQLADASNDNALLAQITNLNAQIESLNNEKATLSGQISTLRQQLSAAQSGSVDSAALHTQITLLEKQLEEKVKIAEELRVENETLKNSSTRSDDNVSAIVL